MKLRVFLAIGLFVLGTPLAGTEMPVDYSKTRAGKKFVAYPGFRNQGKSEWVTPRIGELQELASLDWSRFFKENRWAQILVTKPPSSMTMDGVSIPLRSRESDRPEEIAARAAGIVRMFQGLVPISERHELVPDEESLEEERIEYFVRCNGVPIRSALVFVSLSRSKSEVIGIAASNLLPCAEVTVPRLSAEDATRRFVDHLGGLDKFQTLREPVLELVPEVTRDGKLALRLCWTIQFDQAPYFVPSKPPPPLSTSARAAAPLAPRPAWEENPEDGLSAQAIIDALTGKVLSFN